MLEVRDSILSRFWLSSFKMRELKHATAARKLVVALRPPAS